MGVALAAEIPRFAAARRRAGCHGRARSAIETEHHLCGRTLFGVIAIGCPTLALAAVTSGDGRTLVTRSLPIPSGPPGKRCRPRPPQRRRATGTREPPSRSPPRTPPSGRFRSWRSRSRPTRGCPVYLFFSIRVAVLCLPASLLEGRPRVPYPKVRDSLTEESRKKGNQGGNGCISTQTDSFL